MENRGDKDGHEIGLGGGAGPAKAPGSITGQAVESHQRKKNGTSTLTKQPTVLFRSRRAKTSRAFIFEPGDAGGA